MPFAIVVFVEEEGVKVVPLSWINGEKCVWPPKSESVEQLIQNEAAPKEEWSEHQVTIKGIFGKEVRVLSSGLHVSLWFSNLFQKRMRKVATS